MQMRRDEGSGDLCAYRCVRVGDVVRHVHVHGERAVVLGHPEHLQLAPKTAHAAVPEHALRARSMPEREMIGSGCPLRRHHVPNLGRPREQRYPAVLVQEERGVANLFCEAIAPAITHGRRLLEDASLQLIMGTPRTVRW